MGAQFPHRLLSRRLSDVWSRAPLPGDADRYVAEQTRVGRLLGADPLPATARELTAWIVEHPALGPSPGSAQAVRFLRRPPLSWPVRRPYALLFRAAAGALPDRIRQIIGVPGRPGISRWAGPPSLPSMESGASPDWQLALRRMGAPTPPGVHFRQPPAPGVLPDLTNDRQAGGQAGVLRRTSAAALSGRRPWKLGWRRRPSAVHSVNAAAPTRSGRAQWRYPSSRARSTNGDSASSHAEQIPWPVDQHTVGESGADLAGITEAPLLVVVPDQDGRPGRPGSGWFGPTTDDQFLAGGAFQLQPVGDRPT